MDTAPNLPALKLKVQSGIEYTIGREHIIEIEEHHPCKLCFIADDPEARLYMPGLDIATEKNGDSFVPIDPCGWESESDPEGNTIGYRKRDSEFELFQYSKEDTNADSKYEQLRVGTYNAYAKIRQQIYPFTLKVVPNTELLTQDQWNTMVTEVDSECVGLARDIVRLSVGLYNHRTGLAPTGDDALIISTEKLYRFMVFRAYNERILTALLGIQSAPKNSVVTQYIQLPAGISHRIDPKSIQMTTMRGRTKGCIYGPKKFITYDIPENRLLKKIIDIYDRELTSFLELIHRLQNLPASHHSDQKMHLRQQSKQYRHAHEMELERFESLAEKLSKTTYIIKSQPWYQDVQTATTEEFPHSFAMDPRYGVLLRLYQDLQQEEVQCRCHIDPFFSWKTSYDLYEMWCYLKLCRMLLRKGWVLTTEALKYESDSVFPTLKRYKSQSFSGIRKGINVQIDVFYNQKVNTQEKAEANEPLCFWNGRHNLPDIRIDLYTDKDSKEKETKYWGSLILECKYRTKKEFWDSQQNSIEQFMSYYVQGYTLWQPKEKEHWEDQREYFHPVKQVIILTPDSVASQSLPHLGHIKALPLKPGNAPEEMLSNIVEDFINRQLWTGCYWIKSP